MAKKVTPKPQREISISLQTPYDKTLGNPNSSTFDIKDRGNQTNFKGDKTKSFTLGFTEIDEAITYYINKVIQPSIFSSYDYQSKVDDIDIKLRQMFSITDTTKYFIDK